MKTLLDHFAYRWIPHRPVPEMFGKRAVIITQCLGSGAKSAAKKVGFKMVSETEEEYIMVCELQ